MIFHHPLRIEFNHCDPAGIVFYPRYFEMLNSVGETFFREVAGHSYGAMMAVRSGVPTAALSATFHAPSRLEEVLDWRLEVMRLGTSSIAFRVTAHCGESHRLSVDQTLVHVGAAGRPEPWPDPVRSRVTAFMEAP